MITALIIMLIYRLILKIRNGRFDKGKAQSVKYDVPVISVGNVTAGGTGKTPMVELLVRMLSQDYRVAVVSRGYKRKTRGMREVEATDTALNVGDEPLQIKRKFPEITVMVDRDRNEAIDSLLARPEAERPQAIILDDGFQYRKVTPDRNIILVDYNRPVFKDKLLPFGHLRDLPEQIRRADMVVMTKSPEYMDEWERDKARSITRLRQNQEMIFAKIRYCGIQPVFKGVGDRHYIYSKEVYLFSGVADDRPLIVHLSDNYERIFHKTFGDHHNFTRRDIRGIESFAARNPRTLLLTTEKDAQRLLHNRYLSDEVRRRLFYLPIETAILTTEEEDRFEAYLLECMPEKPQTWTLF